MYLFNDLNIIMSIEKTVGCRSQLQVEEGEVDNGVKQKKKKMFFFLFLSL